MWDMLARINSDKGGSGTMNFMLGNPLFVRSVVRGTVIACLILSLSACKGFPFLSRPQGTGTPSPQVVFGQADIMMQMNAFHPQKLTIKAGTAITWINKDPAYHSVIADGGQFQSGLLAIGQVFSFTFDKEGTYPYHCGINGGPGGKGMSGEIDVVP
jgi:plastocyanin